MKFFKIAKKGELLNWNRIVNKVALFSAPRILFDQKRMKIKINNLFYWENI